MNRKTNARYESAMAALSRRDLAGALPLIDAALRGRPRDAEMRHNLAGALIQAGDIGRALILLTQALAIRPKLRVSAEMLSSHLKQVSLTQATMLDPRGLMAALQVQDVDPQPLARAAMAWLAQADPSKGGVSDLLALGERDGWETAADQMLRRLGTKTAPNPLLWRALTRGLITDLRLEFLLAAVRRHLLLDAGALDLSKRSQEPLWRALLAQLHNNEHVWPQSAEETDALAALDLDPVALAAGDSAAGRVLILRGLYHAFESMPELSDGAVDLAAIRPSALSAIVKDIVESRARERERGAALPSLNPIEDAVSSRVAAQYEANPYPRWQTLNPPRPGAMGAQLAEHMPDADIGFFDRQFEVLVPGCGTGREAIQTAFSCAPHGKVLAFDLSRASLGYAVAAAERSRAPGITFAQGDILNLGSLERRFRLIVCSGVLHHLEDPLAGWRALLEVLHPGGMMRIALYSRLARQDVARLHGIMGGARPRTPEALREARVGLIARHWEDLSPQFRTSTDFFSTSGCRDLFFHEQEHQFTIPQLRETLSSLGLAFHGFVLPRLVRQGFQRWAPPGSTSMTDLDAWWAYEQEQPRTFAGMYTFWCRRV